MKNKDKRQFVITANYIQEVKNKQKATKKDLEELAERIDKMYQDFLTELSNIQ
mgnify:CR=1 FL=1